MQLIKDDLFRTKEDILIHGCNCFNQWGAGVARNMRGMYPEAWKKDQQTLWGNKNKLGSFTFWSGKHYYYDQDIIVINLYSQYKYGHTEVYADYDAIRKGLTAIEFTFRGKTFAMPKIGCGLAHGDWEIVSRIIEEVFKDYEDKVKVYYL